MVDPDSTEASVAGIEKLLFWTGLCTSESGFKTVVSVVDNLGSLQSLKLLLPEFVLVEQEPWPPTMLSIGWGKTSSV